MHILKAFLCLNKDSQFYFSLTSFHDGSYSLEQFYKKLTCLILSFDK